MKGAGVHDVSRMNRETPPKGATTTASMPGVLRYSECEIDIDRGELRIAGRAVAVRPKTFKIPAPLWRGLRDGSRGRWNQRTKLTDCFVDGMR